MAKLGKAVIAAGIAERYLSEQCAQTTEPIYRFPANKKAENVCLSNQAYKVGEEARELIDATNSPYLDEMHIIEEAWDVIQAAEGVLRKYPDTLLESMHKAVIEKCRARGDYDD